MEAIVDIREYTEADKPELLDILKMNIPKYFVEKEYDDYSNYLDERIEKYFVILSDDKIVGGGGLNFEIPAAVISWDNINPEYQGKGVGNKLLQHRISYVSRMKNIIKINVRTSQKTYRFYQKNGFQLKKTIKDYWAEGFDLYYMEYY